MSSFNSFFVLCALFSLAYTAVTIPKPPRNIATPRPTAASGEHSSVEHLETIDEEVDDVAKSTTSKNYNPNEYEKEQNRNARYSFSTNIDDKISDLTHQRSETREGVNVEGVYSYSDGYHKRTVHYVADEKGFRIVKIKFKNLLHEFYEKYFGPDNLQKNYAFFREEVEPLSEEGPKVDLTGSASVDTQLSGTKTAYKIQSVPVEGPVGKIVNENNAKIVEEIKQEFFEEE